MFQQIVANFPYAGEYCDDFVESSMSMRGNRDENREKKRNKE